MSKKVVRDRAFLRYVLVARFNEKRKNPQFEKVVLVFYISDPPVVTCDAKRVIGFLKLEKKEFTDYRLNESNKTFYCIEVFDNVMLVTGGWLDRRKRRGLAFHHTLLEILKGKPDIRKQKLFKTIQELYDQPDIIESCKVKIDEIQGVMVENIDKMFRNMEKTEQLDGDSTELNFESKKFGKKGRKLSAGAAVLAGITGAFSMGMSGTLTGGAGGLVIGAPLGLSLGLGITGACGGFEGGSATIATVVVVSAGSILVGGFVGGGAGAMSGTMAGGISGAGAISAPVICEGSRTGSQKVFGLIYEGIDSEEEEEEEEDELMD